MYGNMLYQPYNPYQPAQFTNPYAPQQQQPQQRMPDANQFHDECTRVNGIKSVEAFYLPPNSRKPFFDENEDVMYIKSTDASGFATTDVYDICRRVETTDKPDYVTKADLAEFGENLRKEIMSNAQQFVQKPSRRSASTESTE